MVIVSNTSPISNLLIIDEISLLQQIYPKILIPPAVHAELTRLAILQSKMLSLLPEKYGRPISHWTARELADELTQQKIVESISQRHVERLLSETDLKPHS